MNNQSWSKLPKDLQRILNEANASSDERSVNIKINQVNKMIEKEGRRLQGEQDPAMLAEINEMLELLNKTRNFLLVIRKEKLVPTEAVA